MAHPDLFDDLFSDLLAGYDAGKFYARIDDERGFVWQHIEHGGVDDALPREQLLIASVIQQFIEDTNEAHWHTNELGINGVVFHDENSFMPLSDLGVSKQIGFYQLSHFPSVVNDAGDY